MSKVEKIAEVTPIYQYIGKIWHYPLFQIGHNNLIVGNIILATVLIWLGMKYRKLLSARISNYINHKKTVKKIVTRKKSAASASTSASASASAKTKKRNNK